MRDAMLTAEQTMSDRLDELETAERRRRPTGRPPPRVPAAVRRRGAGGYFHRPGRVAPGGGGRRGDTPGDRGVHRASAYDAGNLGDGASDAELDAQLGVELALPGPEWLTKSEGMARTPGEAQDFCAVWPMRARALWSASRPCGLDSFQVAVAGTAPASARPGPLPLQEASESTRAPAS
jgi:hypothetical protein